MSYHDDSPGAFTYFLLVFCVAVMFFNFGSCSARDTSRMKAIEAGVGEYYIDANQEKQFRFIPNKVSPTNTATTNSNSTK